MMLSRGPSLHAAIFIEALVSAVSPNVIPNRTDLAADA